MQHQSTRQPGNPWRSNRGSVAVIIAVTLTMVIGFVALGTEVVFVLFKQRQMETVASAAALAAATALMTGHPASPATEAQAVAATGGFTNGTAGVTVTVNNPPKSGPNTSNATDVEVIIAQPQILPLSSLFYAGTWNVSGRAVATEGNANSDCVLQLDPSSVVGVNLNNGAVLKLNSCSLAVNANGGTALSIAGTTLDAEAVTISGSDTLTGGGAINATNGVKTSQPATTNPYSGTAVPSDAGCTYTNLQINSSQTISQGIYCGWGISVGNGYTVTMNPGVYIIKDDTGDGTFTVGSGKVTGTGVTVVLTGSGSNYATVSISNSATVTLSAPTTGATAGMVFFADPASPSTPGSSFEGGTTTTLTGALYFPSQTVTFENGTSTTATCTQLIAWLLVFTGGGTTTLNNNCSGTGIQPIGATPSRLVE
jgi:hypothetical protein